MLGFRYSRKEKAKCQLLNFLIGQAKLAIYVSRRNKIVRSLDWNVRTIFCQMVKALIFTKGLRVYDALNYVCWRIRRCSLEVSWTDCVIFVYFIIGFVLLKCVFEKSTLSVFLSLSLLLFLPLLSLFL